MEIEQILEQYFEGLTTEEEETMLRRFFTSGDVPENLMMYKPLFVHFDNEIKKLKAPPSHSRKAFILWISGVAACAALFAGSFFLASQQKRCPVNGNYVMIDGRCYTDEATIRSTVMSTFFEISEVEGFSTDSETANAIEMIEYQLKDFDFLLEE